MLSKLPTKGLFDFKDLISCLLQDKEVAVAHKRYYEELGIAALNNGMPLKEIALLAEGLEIEQ